MISMIDINRFNNTIELYGLSTDVKPTETIEFQRVNYTITNGSTFYEMDTTAAFLFDQDNRRWLQQ